MKKTPRYETLSDVYRALPSIKCKGLCQECCGPIGLWPAELEEYKRLHIELPVCENGTLTCSLLTKKGRCSVYQHRPIICRVWGLTKTMRCPHGCVPSEWLSDKRVTRLMSKIRRMSSDEGLYFSLEPSHGWEIASMEEHLHTLRQHKRSQTRNPK